MGDNISDTHEWRRLGVFHKGDFIHCWGDDLLVIKVEHEGSYTKLSYLEVNGEERFVRDDMAKQYIARKRQEKAIGQ